MIEMVLVKVQIIGATIHIAAIRLGNIGLSLQKWSLNKQLSLLKRKAQAA